jgi:hypothetical protein
MAEERQPILRSREPNAMFDVYLAPQITDAFADGIGQTMTGPAVTKLEFYRLLGFEGEGENRIEKREMFLRLSIPSVLLVDGLGTIFQTLANNIPQFEAAAHGMTDVITKSVKKIQDVKL